MARPPNVGVLAIEVFLPRSSVRADALEQADGCPGKYVKGLGQTSLSFATDREDAISMAMTVVHNLLEKYGLSARRIGRLEVGSESNPDRSRSIKAQLMKLMGAAGNNDLEGVDSVHGCYGATAALFNAVNWIESCSWDGRLALVVASDVAMYEPGSPARATGGAGAVAVLIGANAPLVIDPAWRATYADATTDFCKPSSSPGPFPVLDGQATIKHFLRAADHVFLLLYKRLQTLHQRVIELQAAGNLGLVSCFDVSNGLLPHVDFFVSHAPFSRLVSKAFARMALQDALRTPLGLELLSRAGVPPRWQMVEPDALPGQGYGDKALESALLSACARAIEEKVSPGLWAQCQTGNIYTGSVFLGLARLWESQGEMLDGRRVLLFAYGSGLMSSLFSLVGRAVPGGEFTLGRVAGQMGLGTRLASQVARTPGEYDSALAQAKIAWSSVPYTPVTPVSELEPGTWYLAGIDSKHVRTYDRAPPPRSRDASGRTGGSGNTAAAGSKAGSANQVAVSPMNGSSGLATVNGSAESM